MHTIGNIIWLLVVGLISAIAYALIGIVLYITIIGIPFGIQCFKFAKLTLSPFGKKVEINFDSHPIANILWLIFIGISMSLGYLISSLVLIITIIGIPFAKQCFKMAKLSLIPFGARIS